MATVVVLAAASRLAYCYHRGLGAGLDHLYDDALITLRYARNLASGLGLVYNPGEVFLGTSSPLYAALMALPAALGLDPIWSAVLFNLGCDAAIALLLLRLGRGFPAFQALAPLAFLVQGNVLYWSGTGMEFSLLVLLGFGAVAAFAAGRPGLAGLLAGIALVGRLDAAIFLAGFGIVALGDRRRVPWRFLAFLAAAAGPWFLYSTVVYGHVVPLSARARYLLYQSPPWSGQAATVLLESAWLVPAAIGAWLAWRREQETPPRLLFFLRSLSLHPLFFLLVYEATGGRIYRRYQVALDAQPGRARRLRARRVRGGAPDGPGRRRLGAAGALLVCAALLVEPDLASPALPVAADRACRATRCTSRSPAGWPPTAPPDATVMAGNIGYLGYFSRRRIFDIKGLVSPAAYEVLRQGRPAGELVADGEARLGGPRPGRIRQAEG